MKRLIRKIHHRFFNKDNGTCKKCGALCCRHIALEIDKPKSKRDFDQIRWYLLHENIEIFIDHDNGWYLKFPTNCTKLSGTICSVYARRPDICRDYPEKDFECEYAGDGNYYKRRFLSETDLTEYLSARASKSKTAGKNPSANRKS